MSCCGYTGTFETDYSSFIVVQVGFTFYSRKTGLLNTTQEICSQILSAIVEKSEDFAGVPIAPGDESGSFSVNISDNGLSIYCYPAPGKALEKCACRCADSQS